MKKNFPQELIVKNLREVPDFPKIEKAIGRFWEQEKIFEKSLEQTKDNERFIFYDGPPFATGLPHYGHLVASTTKDVFPRFQTMLGKYVERVWGWDCHGLPIENIVEKELNLEDKRAIEDFGVENFCESCRGKVQLYVSEWKRVIKRLGRWVDMERAYKTMDLDFMENEWRVFKTLWEKQLIYKGYKSMHVCPRCNTPLSNFEVNLGGYWEVVDISVYVKFRLLHQEDLGLKGEVYLIAWTTTPWTLPGNFLLAVNKNIEYVAVKTESETVIMAAEMVEKVMGERRYELGRVFSGSDLVGRVYEPLMPYFAGVANAFRVVEADFVNLEEGTGIVHIAPAYGEDDYYLGKREGIEIKHHVGMDGRMSKEVTEFAGREVYPSDERLKTNVEIIKYLASRNQLLGKKKIRHRYPHCWRCDHALLNYATDSYFIQVEKFRKELVANNDKINWVPEHFKEGRFGKWLAGAQDWAISRNRFWGTPLPLWVNEEGEFICVGSKKELEDLAGVKIKDLHKPVVDKIEIVKDGKKYKRVSEVLDCWFESGSVPYLGDKFPADFISEGQDQTRGWFYTLHVLAALLKGEPAFRNVLVNGIVLASDGKKMSKKLQNYPDPEIIFDKYGADSLRLYLMISPLMKAENLNFNEQDVARLRRQVLLLTWNVWVFWRGAEQDSQKQKSEGGKLHILDRYLQQKTQQLINEVTTQMQAYRIGAAGYLLMEFSNFLSTFYLRQSRERLKVEPEARASIYQALYNLSLLLAPLTPFFSEFLYQNLGGERESVHLEKWPAVKKVNEEKYLAEKMKLLAELMQLGNAERRSLGIKTRQPLSKLVVKIPATKRQNLEVEEWEELLAAELNVKKIEWQEGEGKEIIVQLETKLTKELIAEGQARELMREIAGERKKQGLDASDEWSYQVKKIPRGWREEIERKTKTKLVLVK